MTVTELIEELEALREDCGGETEVRFASQPNWPFEYSIGEVVSTSSEEENAILRMEMKAEGATDEEIAKELGDPDDDGNDAVIYLSEGRQIGYLPEAARDVLGW